MLSSATVVAALFRLSLRPPPPTRSLVPALLRRARLCRKLARVFVFAFVFPLPVPFPTGADGDPFLWARSKTGPRLAPGAAVGELFAEGLRFRCVMSLCILCLFCVSGVLPPLQSALARSPLPVPLPMPADLVSRSVCFGSRGDWLWLAAVLEMGMGVICRCTDLSRSVCLTRSLFAERRVTTITCSHTRNEITNAISNSHSERRSFAISSTQQENRMAKGNCGPRANTR